MNNLLENPYISTSLAVFLVLYGGLAAPTLHPSIANLFNNPFFRLVVIFLIAYTSTKNHSIALISTIVLVFIIQGSNEVLDSDESTEETGTTTTTVTTETTSAEQVNTTQINQNIKAQHKYLHKVMDEDLLSEKKSKDLLKKALVTEEEIATSVVNQEVGKLQKETVQVQVEQELPGPNEISRQLSEIPTEETCSSCNGGNKNYDIEIDSYVLPYSEPGHFVFNNLGM
jgi:mannitol-specific phosphotransferase system IIBC component